MHFSFTRGNCGINRVRAITRDAERINRRRRRKRRRVRAEPPAGPKLVRGRGRARRRRKLRLDLLAIALVAAGLIALVFRYLTGFLT